MLTISTVIPTKNRRDDLLKCVKSILAQKLLPDQLIIIDQSDNDQAKLEVEKILLSTVPELDVNYVLDSSIAGLIEAKKYSVTLVKSDVVMFLEDDVVLNEDYVEKIIQGFVENRQMMGCCGIVNDVPAKHTFYRKTFSIFHRGIFFDPRVKLYGERSLSRMIPSSYLSGGLSAFRKAVFDSVPYDVNNNFFMLEDIDFSMRAVDVFGQNQFFINTTARLDHALSTVNREIYFPKHQRKTREFICFYKKHRSKPWALVSLMWLLNGLLIESILKSIRSLRLSPLSGTLSGLYQGIKWRIRPY